MQHKCNKEGDEPPIVYIGDCWECSEDVAKEIAYVCSGGYKGAGYYIVIGEEYLDKISYCPYCGMHLSKGK